jgi:matrixin
MPKTQLVLRCLVMAAVSIGTLVALQLFAGRQTITSAAVYSSPQAYGFDSVPRQLSSDYLAQLNGDAYQWPKEKLPLKVYIDNGDGVPAYRPSMRAILVKCFDKWSEASQGRLAWKQVSDPSQADVTCKWAAELGTINGDVEAGKTQTEVVRHGRGQPEVIDVARLTLLTQMQGRMMPDVEIGKTALHEVGHVWGLQGHSKNPDDIMYYAVNHTRLPYLSERDINTLNRLYGDYPATFSTIGSNGAVPQS